MVIKQLYYFAWRFVLSILGFFMLFTISVQANGDTSWWDAGLPVLPSEEEYQRQMEEELRLLENDMQFDMKKESEGLVKDTDPLSDDEKEAIKKLFEDKDSLACQWVGDIWSDAYKGCMQRLQELNQACGAVPINSKEKCEENYINCRTEGLMSDELCWCKARWGIMLNTNVPFIGRCIEMWNKTVKGKESLQVSQGWAFPFLLRALINIAVSLILVSSLITVIVGWVMIASSRDDNTVMNDWKNLIRKAIIGLIMLWASWIILALINPNFFG